jgi:hypothetical protein
MRRALSGAFALLLACAALPNGAQAENSSLTVIVFPGVQNLPMFAAQAKGFYARRGLNVEIKFTPNSAELGHRSLASLQRRQLPHRRTHHRSGIQSGLFQALNASRKTWSLDGRNRRVG